MMIKLFVQRFYKDEGESGVSEARMGLQRLLRDCRAGRIAMLVLPALDRLSRDGRLAKNLFYQLEQAGVEVLIADMPTTTERTARTFSSDRSAKRLPRTIGRTSSNACWKGRHARVRKGKPAGGNVAYGYQRVAKAFVIHEPEAGVVRLILEFAARGLSGTAIAPTLNAQEFKRRNGKAWTQRQVAAVVSRRERCVNGLMRGTEALASLHH